MVFRLLIFCLLFAASLPSYACDNKTNVVLILTDNQGYFELACKGNPYLRTPHIDEFAQQGVDFCNFHAVPLLKGDADWQDERVIVMQCPRARERMKWRHAAVKQGHWRLVSNNRLYNIQTDSLMQHDLAKEHPELVAKLNAAYEKFWHSLPPERDIVQRHLVGAKESPSTVLCAMDWREGGAPWNSGALRGDFRGQGAWCVRVVRSGRYRITLRRTMKETPLPIGAVHAKVQVGSHTADSTASIEDTEIVVEVDLDADDYSLQAWLQAPDNPEDTWGANFAYVELLSEK